jgi:hypothetical protein
MECKTFEVRDSGTFMPVLAIKLRPACEEDRFVLGRAGFGTTEYVQAEYVILVALEKDEATYDPFKWLANGTRTLNVAHHHIIDHWSDLRNGAVVDVEYILGETPTPKASERLLYGV